MIMNIIIIIIIMIMIKNDNSINKTGNKNNKR
jgi:hypothetical protein